MRQTRMLTGWAVALLVTLSIVPVSRPAGAAGPGLMEKVGNGTVDWTAGQIAVTGSGAAPDHGGTAQKRLLARRAAVVDGYRQIAEIINGVRVNSETVVKDFVTESDTIRTQVSALVKGARIGEPRFLSDGAVEVDVRVPMYGQGSLADAVDLEKVPSRPHHKRHAALPPTYDLGAAVAMQPLGLLSHRSFFVAAGGTYTGVIIDCSAVGIQPAMSPTVLDESQNEIYVGTLPVDPDIVVNEGIVSYKASVGDARADTNRAGNNPLLMSAQQSAGQFRADAVLSPDDSANLAQANIANPFLAQTKVSFVIRR